MSYPLDTAAQNAALDALLSRDLSGIPTTFEVALYDGDPRMVGSAELDSTGGYERPTIDLDSTDWNAASGGSKTSVSVQFADSTDEWSDTAPWAVLVDASDHTTRWYPVLLTEEVNVLEAGAGPSVVLNIYWNTLGA